MKLAHLQVKNCRQLPATPGPTQMTRTCLNHCAYALNRPKAKPIRNCR